MLKDNKHSTMEYLAKKIKEKYKDFDITPQHLSKVITRKRTKHKHYPKTRYGKETNLKADLETSYISM